MAAIKGSAALWSPKMPGGMGAHFALDLIEGLALDDLAALQVPLLVTSSHAGDFLHRAAGPGAWVMGHEGQGVSPALEDGAACASRIAQPVARVAEWRPLRPSACTQADGALTLPRCWYRGYARRAGCGGVKVSATEGIIGTFSQQRRRPAPKAATIKAAIGTIAPVCAVVCRRQATVTIGEPGAFLSLGKLPPAILALADSTVFIGNSSVLHQPDVGHHGR